MEIKFFDKAEDVVLEAEVNPEKSEEFEKEYKKITGDTPMLGHGYQHQKNKWGVEVRVYFNSPVDMSKDFNSIGVNLEKGDRPYRRRWIYRSNDREFFWSLVKAGYRLG